MGAEPGPGVRIGVDDWVAEAAARTQVRAGPLGQLRGAVDRVGPGWRLAVLVAAVAAVPVLGGSQLVIRIGINALLFALLALGLNVIVGEAGLLDLGYIAFYGFGAYGYALLSSNQFHLHWPSELTILLVTVATAGLGLLLGLPSRRLLGDYLAIVTLFFGQMFVQLTTNLDRFKPPWASKPLNITGGPNGIFGVDPMRIGPVHLISQEDYLYLLLGLLAVALVAIHRLVASRTGRAWRALREDATAAEQSGIPVRRLKLFAFAVGGGIAGLSGTAFAAVQLGVFPQNFDLTLLIMIYAAVVLGGAGSLSGVLLGAAVISVLPEVLRNPDNGRLLFYGALLVLLLARVRPWWRPLALLGATVALGIVIRLAARALWPHAVTAAGAGSDALGRALGAWVVVPTRPVAIGNAAFVVLVAAVLALTRLQNAGHVSVPRPGSPAATSGGDGADPGDHDERAAARPARPAQGGGGLMPASRAALLELQGVSRRFGGLAVISELDLHVDEGEVVSVIGPNGAGKTTLFNLVTGVYRPDAGAIRLDGRQLVGLEPHTITRLGVARTFQTVRLFLNMTVKENVMAAAYGHTRARPWQSVLRTPAARREERATAELAERQLAFFGTRLVGYRHDQPAYSLSYANRRRLEIARAMATRPRILLLDEPAAGMNPAETHEMTELIGRLRDEGGYTILVIEHDMHVVAGVSDRVVALDHGTKISEGPFDRVAADPRVIEAYLGLRAERR